MPPTRREDTHENSKRTCDEKHAVIFAEIRHIQESIKRLESDLHETQDDLETTKAENRRLTSRLDVSEGKALVWSIIGSSLAAIIMKILFDKLSTH